MSVLGSSAVTGKSVDYPRSVVDLPKNVLGQGLPPGPSPWTTVLGQLLALPSATNAGAESLATQLWDRYFTCPDAVFLLAGYSQGAWVIDKALRILSGDGPIGHTILARIKGVFLMGDPAWVSPGQKQEGVASVFGKGYGTRAAYLDNDIPGSRFDSGCLTADPVCYWQGTGKLSKDISTHVYGYISGGVGSIATDGGYWLASQI